MNDYHSEPIWCSRGWTTRQKLVREAFGPAAGWRQRRLKASSRRILTRLTLPFPGPTLSELLAGK